MDVLAFQRKWIDASRQMERSAYVTHFNDLCDVCKHWLNPEGASEAELKKRTLTNLYNAKPTWLANAHAALDRAIWDAYGWPGEEVPGEVEEDVILSRLLALNWERAGVYHMTQSTLRRVFRLRVE